jgi:streptomycin 6-kinase
MRTDPYQPWLSRWGLAADGPPFTTRFGSHLLPVLCDGEPAMLKIAVHEEERRGGALMEWWGGVGAARVLRREADALVLERVAGERSLAAMALDGRDDEATAILCETAMRLHAPRATPAPDTLIPLDPWFASLSLAEVAHGGTFTKSAVAAAELLAEPRDVVVLHGDYHHDNVLDGGERGWLVIDPKGLIGERGFEYANLFRNPTAEQALAPGVLAKRAAIVAERAQLEPSRLLKWVLAYAGLGAAWSIESGHDPAPGLAIAEAAAKVLGV